MLTLWSSVRHYPRHGQCLISVGRVFVLSVVICLISVTVNTVWINRSPTSHVSAVCFFGVLSLFLSVQKLSVLIFTIEVKCSSIETLNVSKKF